MTSVRLALIGFSFAACAKQAPVHAPAPASTTKTLDIYHLCEDTRFQSMCTPATIERGMQVDINLESQRPRTAFPA